MTNYTRGYRFEQWIVNTLKDEGYIAQRTAGSHSCVDVIAMKHVGIRLIQAKTCKKDAVKVMERELARFREMRSKLPMVATLEVWVKEDRKEPIVGVIQ